MALFRCASGGGGGTYKVVVGTATINTSANTSVTVDGITSIKSITTRLTNGQYKTFNAWCADSYDSTKVLSVTQYNSTTTYGTTGQSGAPVPSTVSGNQFQLQKQANTQYGSSVEYIVVGQ